MARADSNLTQKRNGLANKFTENGQIRIVADLEGGDRLRIVVTDTGQGVPLEERARLFEPIVQVDGTMTRRHDGAGLGLAVTRRLARLMGGDVTFSKMSGSGSTFTLVVGITHALAA